MVLKKKIVVVGTGYVGLVTGVSLSEIGHTVICLDIDQTKVKKMKNGISPIYEPGIEELMKRNIEKGTLDFTTSYKQAFENVEVIYIAVGTPEREDGTADLKYIKQVALDIAYNIKNEVVIVIKSTVPIGTNEFLEKYISSLTKVKFHIVSNPEFLREGSALHDTFHGDRIIIGAENKYAASIVEKINQPFGIEIFTTNLRSAEMIKYASNAFLATKISFINEIADLCERLEANIEEVATGMGFDKRIGKSFLNAGIGYGGSCFPKDTKALVNIAGQEKFDFNLLRAVIEVNKKQQVLLVTKAKEYYGSLKGKRIALLGLAFKPNTDDMREAASIITSEKLILSGAEVVCYDPIAMDNAKKVLPEVVEFANSAEEALQNADAAFIMTEWEEIKNIPISKYSEKLRDKVLFDGRNCYDLNSFLVEDIDYFSVGRPSVLSKKQLV
ncbi:UDP-glucose dehydrogenase family protein [Planococcus shixiaomingii]|uniref:UDP-glucose dehydrogenase family protein n=1 Tax=Planococcus shixiaomingii TaxID=3058393 RepID=UPI00260AA286|nr:UDP-glucose/GDP-mannose dehydrogenase family protein [Planococcus sp. N022]WKA53996.1 UDP-glucose/GDP-mannose dehydrogenase family protein [Planococcus sp. N022]